MSDGWLEHLVYSILNSLKKTERGEKLPSGASLKLLSLVQKNGLATVA